MPVIWGRLKAHFDGSCLVIAGPKLGAKNFDKRRVEGSFYSLPLGEHTIEPYTISYKRL